MSANIPITDPRMLAITKLAEALGLTAVCDYSVELEDRGLGWSRVVVQFDAMKAVQVPEVKGTWK